MRELHRFVERHPQVGGISLSRAFPVRVASSIRASRCTSTATPRGAVGPLVEIPFDGPAVCVAGLDQAPSRPTQMGYLDLKSIDDLLRLLARASVRHRPPLPRVVAQCPDRKAARVGSR